MQNGKIFNRALLKQRRNRAAVKWPDHNFLKVEAAKRIVDALQDMTKSFPVALDIGCHAGELKQILGTCGGIKTLVECDVAGAFSPQIVCDEEWLPFAPNSFDLVMSALSLHHVNDLPGTLIQILECLKPDGLFIAILPGASTLKELREAVTAVSAEYDFPLSPRLSPFIEVRDAGALLQRAGFALPVLDSDMITVEYDNAVKLMKDLRGMGESNVLIDQRKTFTPCTHLMTIDAWYDEHFQTLDDKIAASFEFITMTGWKPHASQQQPAKRGSGQVNLKRVL